MSINFYSDIIDQLDNALARLDTLGLKVPAVHVSMALDLLRIQATTNDEEEE